MSVDSLWLRNYHDAPPDAPVLVFLPHAGGSATYFFPLSRALKGVVRTYAVQYPGRQDRMREPLIDTVVGLAEQVWQAMTPLLAGDAPVVLFGHSLGASVGYEIMRLAESGPGRTPVHLIASSRGAPDDGRQLGIHHLSDRDLISEVGFLSGTASSILADDEMMQAFLPAIRNDYRAAETYAADPSTPLRAPITAFTGTSDPRVTAADVAGWQRFTSAEFSLIEIPGGHFYLTDEIEITTVTTLRVMDSAMESLKVSLTNDLATARYPYVNREEGS